MSIEAATTWVYGQAPQYRNAVIEAQALNTEIVHLALLAKDGAILSVLLGIADVRKVIEQLSQIVQQMQEEQDGGSRV